MISLKLVPASKNDYPLIQNMARFYVYDISEYMGWELPKDGLYECIDFKHYWESENSYPFLIYIGQEIAGFAIVDKIGTDEKVDFSMAQFFILRKFKGKGWGCHAARQCFDQFKGIWEVMVLPSNEGAYQFWKRIIKEYTNDLCEEYIREIVHFDKGIRKIFRFQSKN